MNNNIKIRKAVIMAAGYGTRFLPLTKSINKVMIPVLNRPVIDYGIEQCIKAGIEEFIIIIKAKDRQIIDYYSENIELKNYLLKMGKLDRYQELELLHTKAKFKFIEQTEDMPYGTATPLGLAYEYIKNEEVFLVTNSDDFLFNSDKSNEIGNMIVSYQNSDVDSIIAFTTIDRTQVSRYGVARYHTEGNSKILDEIIEKPAVEDAPSNLIGINRFIFKPEVALLVKNQKLNPVQNELLITDTVTEYINSGHKVLIHENTSEFLDCGEISKWLKTNLRIARENNELWKNLIEYIEEIK